MWLAEVLHEREIGRIAEPVLEGNPSQIMIFQDEVSDEPEL